MSNKADIRKAAFNATVPQEDIYVEEWDSTVTVKGMTAGAAVDFYASASKELAGESKIDMQLWGPGLLIACVFDADGEQVFGQADRDLIKQMPYAVVTPLQEAAARVSGLGGKDDDRAVIEDFGDGL